MPSDSLVFNILQCFFFSSAWRQQCNNSSFSRRQRAWKQLSGTVLYSVIHSWDGGNAKKLHENTKIELVFAFSHYFGTTLNALSLSFYLSVYLVRFCSFPDSFSFNSVLLCSALLSLLLSPSRFNSVSLIFLPLLLSIYLSFFFSRVLFNMKYDSKW